MNRKAFIGKLTKKFSLRIHMTLILTATVMAGASASKLMLLSGINNPAIRYPLTVLIAYLIFFIAVKIWLKIITAGSIIQVSNSNATTDFPSDISLPGITASGPDTVSGGGGTFSGAGASASFDDSPSIPASSSGASSSIDFDVDEIGVVVLLILLALLVAAVLGAGVYLVYNAPAILSEVAFDSFLALSLTKKTKTIRDNNWIGSIFRGTWKQFALILTVTSLTGFAMRIFYPEITKLSELFKIVSSALF